ncbi:MAG: 50S ribosomal protein L14 [Patescibacteria group bacterium]
MIKRRTILKVADNSGATTVQCIGFVKLGNRDWAQVGDTITVSVKTAEPRKQVSKGQVVKAIIVRQKRAIRRADGSYIRFADNAVVILKDKKELMGNRIFGPIPREIKTKGFDKIANLAPELV